MTCVFFRPVLGINRNYLSIVSYTFSSLISGLILKLSMVPMSIWENYIKGSENMCKLKRQITGRSWHPVWVHLIVSLFSAGCGHVLPLTWHTRVVLLQVAVDFEAVVPGISHCHMAVRRQRQPLGSIQGVRRGVYVGQEGTCAVKHLQDKEHDMGKQFYYSMVNFLNPLESAALRVRYGTYSLASGDNHDDMGHKCGWGWLAVTGFENQTKPNQRQGSNILDSFG